MHQMYRTSFAAALASAFLIAAPAMAQQTTVTSEARLEGGSAAPAKPASRAATRYCIDIEPRTGSRVSRRECRTRAEWAREGVDPIKLMRR